MNDDAQARLLHEIAANGFNGASPELRAELLEFFSHPEAPYAAKKDAKVWAQLEAELQLLRDGYSSLAGRQAAPRMTRFRPGLVN